MIGTLLDLPREELKIIEHDNYHKAVQCCNAMLDRWLEVDPSATWKKMLEAIELLSVSSDQAFHKLDIDKSMVTDQGRVDTVYAIARSNMCCHRNLHII